jgi:yecA family protein
MNEETILDFASVQAIITSESSIEGSNLHGAEIHGVLTGLVCAGLPCESPDYITFVNDFFNNGEGFPHKIKSVIKLMFADIWKNILDDNYGFQMLLPDDDESMAERSNALSSWVQGFNLGFGLQQKNTAIASADVKEVLSDFAEIANLADEMEEEEENEQAYFEISEYVRISAVLCFTELGTPPDRSTDKETIH